VNQIYIVEGKDRRGRAYGPLDAGSDGAELVEVQSDLESLGMRQRLDAADDQDPATAEPLACGEFVSWSL
jgi:hypothetical protein